MDSFLMIGQSNMAGRGFKNDVEPINAENLYVMRSGIWEKFYVPVNPDEPQAEISLAETFAESYAKDHKCEVGLFPCAKGDTSVMQWQKGENLFDNAVFAAKLAMRNSELKAILWHQGEADSGEERSAVYFDRLSRMIADMRQALDHPDIPFLVGGLGDFLKGFWGDIPLYYRSVNAELMRAADSIPNVKFVSAEGLGSNPDGIHFNAKSLRIFGKRYYEAYKSLADM